MKTIVIARHGSNTEKGNLSPQGKEQIKYLATLLKKVVKKPAILTSTALRAVESAKILGSLFKVQAEKHQFLYRGVELEKLTNLIKSKAGTTDCIIIVTHLQYIDLFSKHIGKIFLETNFSEQQNIDNGQALIINCKTKKINLVG
jgi:broad specificity phosphatase PhoE